MMQKRTISIKLVPTSEQAQKLLELQREFNNVRNAVSESASVKRCFNQYQLHNLAYKPIRKKFKLGSQMVCIAIKTVCSSYKDRVRKVRSKEVPQISFRQGGSVHLDKRTYSLIKGGVSLYTLSKRVKVPFKMGEFQRKYMERGIPKEAELVRRKKNWFFNLVLDVPDAPPRSERGGILGVDLGENNIACTSTGKIFGGGKLRYERDAALALRARLQSNGTKSAKRTLRKVSGKESRHVKDVNHCVSKALVEEASAFGCDTIAMENLTNIRSRIRAGKRMRSRLHRWPFAQTQSFTHYKAVDAGMSVFYGNPAYTSRTCNRCGQLGVRVGHKFECKNCVIFLHSDVNAALNIRGIAALFSAATGAVNRRNVASIAESA